MENRKALKIIQIFASAGWGGGEKYVLDLSKTIVANGHKVVLISKKCPIISNKIGTAKDYHQLSMKGILDLSSALKLSRIIKSERPDIVHIHNFKDAFVAAYAKRLSGVGVKLVMSRHLVKRAKTSAMYNWLYRQLDSIIFVSHLAKDEFLLSHPQIDSDKIVVVHNSIKSESIHNTEDVRAKYGISLSSVILAFTGRIVPEKGVEVLLDAAEQIRDKDFKLLILGTGSRQYMELLEQSITQKGLTDKVIMTGFVDNVTSVISQSDIGIIPSVSREPFGLSIIEFMELGKPVITTNNGAQPEFIDEGVNGFMVAPSDSTAIAMRLTDLIENPKTRATIGNRAKSNFDSKLSYTVFYDKIYSLYNRVIGRI